MTTPRREGLFEVTFSHSIVNWGGQGPRPFKKRYLVHAPVHSLHRTKDLRETIREFMVASRRACATTFSIEQVS